jgi:signal transduction histidine kinase
MHERIKFFGPVLLVFWAVLASATGSSPEVPATNVLHMETINASGKGIPFVEGKGVSLKPFPENIYFYFRINTNFSQSPFRIRYKLEGYDKDWIGRSPEGNGEMHLAVRFYSDAGDLVTEKMFVVSGASAGWNGSLEGSLLTHRRETLVVPPQAARLMVVISSAGPPATLGVYTVANLAVSKISGNSPPTILLQSPFDQQLHDQANPNDQTPPGWARDGNGPSMAKIVKLGHEPVTKAFAILDDSLISHAEWHNTVAAAPRVTPGDQLMIEWNEMFSIGVGNMRLAIYKSLPPGNFQFHVEAVDIMGVPTGDEASIAIRVPPPFWKTYWFWGGVFTIIAGLAIITGRYVVFRKMRLKMLQLEKRHMLEHERMRIARDIHDDWGARVTQISLVSAMARTNSTSLEQSRENFDQISEMARDLVTALYETVWAVNPENDNLNELGTYLFQMVNKLCERTSCRCRFYIRDLPREIIVSSQIRHNICMAVKEAINNIKKHARAAEITVNMEFTNLRLTISIQDNGCGFEPEGVIAGNGLKNLRQRLQDIGGTCRIESRPGQGTTVQLQLKIKPADAA